MRRAFSILVLAIWFSSCGAKTGLEWNGVPAQVGAGPPPSSAFCAQASYRSGHASLAIYVLLDRSGSMLDDNKWDDATTALDAFVNSSQAAGISIGLQYFPLAAECTPEAYAKPAVPIAALPAHAAAIKASITAKQPAAVGGTPTLPALRGGIEYARALIAANPDEAVVVALVTDGVPNTCNSTTHAVAAIAAEGVKGDPQVLTFVIGLEAGAVEDMRQIASAGGTGDPVLVGKSPDSAQKIVDALQFLRQTQTSCQYAIPDTGGEPVVANDVTVSFTLAAGSTPTSLARVENANACEIANAFYVDDPAAPTRVELCPGACNNLQQSPGSKVTVSAGCGLGSDAGVPDAGPPGHCSGILDLSCVDDCKAHKSVQPVCSGKDWVCPPGSTNVIVCNTCEPVPHGCCKTDGTISTAQCVNGAWLCPPGATSFGDPGCRAPDVCSSLLPCGAGQYCSYPDFACGTSDVAGHCVDIPSSCGTGTATCGCDGLVHASECAASMQSADPSLVTNCATPSGSFACGPYFCKTSQICKETLTLGQAIGGQQYACVDAPAGCTTGCGCNLCGACPSGKVCKESCSQDVGRMLTCTRL